MNKVVLDATLRQRFNGLDGLLELCDESGRILGYYLPTQLYREVMYAWARGQFSDEEIAQAREEVRREGGYTTAEVLANLERLIREKGGQP